MEQYSPGRSNPSEVWTQTAEQGPHAFLLKDGPTEGHEQRNQQSN